jgi:hypothetical protein
MLQQFFEADGDATIQALLHGQQYPLPFHGEQNSGQSFDPDAYLDLPWPGGVPPVASDEVLASGTVAIVGAAPPQEPPKPKRGRPPGRKNGTTTKRVSKAGAAAAPHRAKKATTPKTLSAPAAAQAAADIAAASGSFQTVSPPPAVSNPPLSGLPLPRAEGLAEFAKPTEVAAAADPSAAAAKIVNPPADIISPPLSTPAFRGSDSPVQSPLRSKAALQRQQVASDLVPRKVLTKTKRADAATGASAAAATATVSLQWVGRENEARERLAMYINDEQIVLVSTLKREIAELKEEIVRLREENHRSSIIIERLSNAVIVKKDVIGCFSQRASDIEQAVRVPAAVSEAGQADHNATGDPLLLPDDCVGGPTIGDASMPDAAVAEARRAAEQQEAARIDAAQQEAARVAAEEQAARLAAEEQAARLAAEEQAARLAAEEQAARLAAEEQAARVAAEEQAARVAAEEQAARVAAEEQAARLAAEEQAARLAAEEQAAKLAATECDLEMPAAPKPSSETRVTSNLEPSDETSGAVRVKRAHDPEADDDDDEEEEEEEEEEEDDKVREPPPPKKKSKSEGKVQLFVQGGASIVFYVGKKYVPNKKYRKRLRRSIEIRGGTFSDSISGASVIVVDHETVDYDVARTYISTNYRNKLVFTVDELVERIQGNVSMFAPRS